MSLMVGLASEHFIVTDLAKAGIPSFITPHLMRYDVVADIFGKLCRIQVKATSQPLLRDSRRPSWRFRLTRGIGHSKTYKPDDFDFLAFVCLATSEVAYVPANELVGTSVTFTPSDRAKPANNPSARHFSDYPLSKLLDQLKGAA